MERRAGKYRAILMLSSARRGALAAALDAVVDAAAGLPVRNRVRWHIDVDPQDAG
jgi:primosomal protein N' (replication factor Y)